MTESFLQVTGFDPLVVQAAPGAAGRGVSSVTTDDSGNMVITFTDGTVSVVPLPDQGGGAVDSVNGQTGAVVLDATDIGAATSAQGAKADTAVQPGSLATVATTGAYTDLTGKPTLYTDENAQDAVAAAFAAGTQTGVTVSYDDTANSLSLTVAGGSGAVSSVNGQTGDVVLTQLAKPPLVVDGTLIREGTGGPVYKAVGYNVTVIPNLFPSAQMLDTQAKQDAYFSQLPPNSLTRTWAWAPGTASGISWTTQLATLATLVNTARKYGQRLIFDMTHWGAIGVGQYTDQFDGKTQTWFTSQLYKHSVSGANSFEDWVTAVVSMPTVTQDGTVCIIDVLNEPTVSSGNAASAASYVSYMSGVIKAIDPTLLVYMGINVVGTVGGQAQYQTIAAAQDFCSGHNYNSYGYTNISDPIIVTARALGKPWIIDEHSMIAKSYYGSSGDTDKDSSGWPGVPFQAQGREIERFIASNLAASDCFGVLVFAYPGAQTDGLAHFEPPNGSLGRKVVRNASLQGDQFGFDALGSNVGAWFDGVQNFRYAPGAAVTTWWTRHSTSSFTITSGTAPTAGRFGDYASFLFSGTQLIDQNPWKAGNSTMTEMWAIVPTALPASSAYSYLSGPQTAIAAHGVRINHAGNIEVVQMTGSGGSGAATVQATSSNTVNPGQVNTVAVAWDTAGGGLSIWLNGVLTTATGKTATLTSGNARIGCGYDGSNGFVGHLLEGIYEGIVETNTNIGLALTYFARRYDAPV